MIFNDFDLEDELVGGQRGYDNERGQSVEFVRYSDPDYGMVVVEDMYGDKYETYEDDIEWF